MGNCGRSLIWLECLWLPNAFRKPVKAHPLHHVANGMLTYPVHSAMIALT